MKIKLKIKSQHVVIVHKLLINIGFEGILSKEEKMHKSIFQQVFMKIAKKSLEIQINPVDKPTKLNFSYYEAYELERRLNEVYFHVKKGSYERNAIEIIIDELNQELV